MRRKDRLPASQVSLLEDRHRALLALCLELEDLALELDGGAVPAAVSGIAQRLEPLLTSAQTLEEESFYPSLEDNAGSCFGSLMIAQIKSEHRLDRRAAHELSRTLEAVATGRCGLGLGTVAHMTRGFQEYLRRHISAEQMLLETLTATAAEDAPEPVS